MGVPGVALALILLGGATILPQMWVTRSEGCTSLLERIRCDRRAGNRLAFRLSIQSGKRIAPPIRAIRKEAGGAKICAAGLFCPNVDLAYLGIRSYSTRRRLSLCR